MHLFMLGCSCYLFRNSKLTKGLYYIIFYTNIKLWTSSQLLFPINQKFSFVDYYYYDEPESCINEYSTIEKTEDGYCDYIQDIPSYYFKFIIGKNGQIKRHIESQTKTRLKFPNRESDRGDIGKFITCSIQIYYFLTDFSAMFYFNFPWKHKKTFGFLTFSGGSIKMKHWIKMS